MTRRPYVATTAISDRGSPLRSVASGAARYKSLNLTNRHRRQLSHLDIAFNWSRHITSVKCATLITEIMNHASPDAATWAATDAHDFQQKRMMNASPSESPSRSSMCQCLRLCQTSSCFSASDRKVAPAPADTYAATASVISLVSEYIAPAPSVTVAPPSQQLPLAHTMAAVTTGVSLDTTAFCEPAMSYHSRGGLCPTGRWFTSSLGRECCACVQPGPSGTDGSHCSRACRVLRSTGPCSIAHTSVGVPSWRCRR